MYLKEIVATGFKSFADKINIKLDDEITCIVGPNGSGKSNVVDAVRWVLGEQSVKSLRGDGSMTDVIFSGSKSRNPLNVGQVELIFDNSDNYLPLSYSEVSIKRKAYRSGENEYYINNEKCRLKDIVNLLLDTGIGRESFNIIGQGEVDRILSSSSQDRRLIIEEAAGVTKYKKRKEEALRKLDKTHSNLDRVEDIIKELEVQVEPLREQSIKAKEYLENKEKLTDLEIALLAYDIYNYSEEEKILKEKQKKLEDKILELSNDSNKSDVSLLEENKKLESMQQELSEYNKELLKVVEEASKLNSERLLLIEKNKGSNKSEKELELQSLLEEQGRMKSNISIIEEEVKNINNLINNKSGDLVKESRERDNLKQKLNIERGEYSKLEQELISIRNKINSTINELESLSYIPNGIKRVLNEKSLTGIHNIIGNVINIDDKFSKALEIATASCKNFIITDNEESSKRAVEFLKRENLGRATFFPLDVIKERYIDNETLNAIKNDDDFIAVMSDLVETDKRYDAIVKNQLGLVLVSPDIDSSTRLSKRINRRYKIVSLDGDVINVGGSITGGSSNKYSKSNITLKQELDFLRESEEQKKKDQQNISLNIEKLNTEISEKDDYYFNLSREEVNLKEQLTSKMNNLNTLNESLEVLESNINSLRQIVDDKSISYEQELYDKYLEKNTLKEKININIKNLTNEIDLLKKHIDEENAMYKLKNSETRNLEKEKTEVDIKLSRIDSKLDSMLLTLNEEYQLTYEKARNDYSLSIDSDEARSKVSIYKSNIKRLGMVNLASIEEYDRVNTRYEFLCSQKDDLLMAENSLLDIMREMDDVILEEFTKTYEKVNTEFSKVFKELFRGGDAHLSLNDPNDMLGTGIDIVASPPGKKLKSISLLSGGEKTLTAISLLFAILNVREVPFCLFDEVEAALDEANVETFGKYLSHYKNKTQFLIITHKKKTMEYADTLYGITMQESGVSKLVSVKLSEHVDTL